MRLTALIVLQVLLAPFAFGQSSLDREQRLLEHARYCLVNDLILSAHLKIRQVNIDACRAGELGLAFIGERTSRKAIAELGKLRRYALDGALGESYTCYVLSKGNSVIAEFRKLDLSAERRACESEVAQRLKELGINEQGAIADAVCAKPAIAKTWIQETAASVKARRKCDPRDW